MAKEHVFDFERDGPHFPQSTKEDKQETAEEDRWVKSFHVFFDPKVGMPQDKHVFQKTKRGTKVCMLEERGKFGCTLKGSLHKESVFFRSEVWEDEFPKREKEGGLGLSFFPVDQATLDWSFGFGFEASVIEGR